MIMFLAVRLLVRWRRGQLPRAPAPPRRRRAPPPAPARSTHGGRTTTRTSRRAGSAARRVQAFGIGLVHGIGGSAGVVVLLLATIPEPDRGGRCARRPRDRDRDLDGDAVLGLRLRRSPAAPCSGGCSRLRPRWASSRSPSEAWYALGAVGARAVRTVSDAETQRRGDLFPSVCYASGRSKPFGELTARRGQRTRRTSCATRRGGVRRRRSASVAMAWGELARLMDGSRAPAPSPPSTARRWSSWPSGSGSCMPGGSMLL